MQSWLGRRASQRRAAFRASSATKSLPAYPTSLLITPATVPPFTIPTRKVSGVEPVTSGNACPRSPEDLLDGSCQETAEGARASDSADDSEDAMSTNSDPLSANAMSIPHLQTTTAYGFQTLSERPGTRRKESLFHDNITCKALSSRRMNFKLGAAHSFDEGSLHKVSPESPLGGRRRSRSSQNSRIKGGPKSCSGSPEWVRRRSSKRRDVRGVVAPLGVVASHQRKENEECGCANSTQLSPKCPHNKLFPSVCPPDRNVQLGIQGLRERMLLVPDSPKTLRNVSCRKGSYDFQAISAVEDLRREQRSHSLECPVTLISLAGQPKEVAIHGEVKIGIHFRRMASELRIILIRAENLGPDHLGTINSYAKLALLPGKTHKYRSKVARNSRFPSFHEEVIFSKLSHDRLLACQLLVRLYHKTSGLRRDVCLGECWLALADVNLERDVQVWLPLESGETHEHSLGQLQVGLNFKPFEQRMTVDVIQARGLRPSFRAASNPYAQVELRQPGRTTTRLATDTIRNTASPFFAFKAKIDLSPKIDDLNATSLTMTLYNQDKPGSHVCVGQVVFGLGATEHMEIAHWNRVLQNPGSTSTQWHALMEMNVQWHPNDH